MALSGQTESLRGVLRRRNDHDPELPQLVERLTPPIGRGWLVRRMLLAGDVLGLALAFAAAELFFRGSSLVNQIGIGVETAIFFASIPAWVLAAKLYGLYEHDEERASHSTVDDLTGVFHLVTVGAWIFFATSWLIGLPSPNQKKLATFWALALVLVTLGRWAARTLARRHPAYVQNAIIVGAGDIGQLIARKLLHHPEYGINLVGFVDDDPKEPRGDIRDVGLLGSPDALRDLIRRHRVQRVIIAFSRDHHERLLELLRSLRRDSVQIDVVPRLFEAVAPNVGVHMVEGLPLLGLPTVRMSRSSLLLKRCFDMIAAGVLLVVTAPILALVALLVRRDSPGPVFFKQTRLGMNMRPFSLLKFRTMHDGTDDEPHRAYVGQIMTADALPSSNSLYKLDRAADVTRVGRILRRTSLDELPQLLNVIRGDMSLVGPRPCIPYELELFATHHFERFLVPAGLTGLWQVEARAHSTFAEALDLDVAYARGRSLGLDFRLLLRTPFVIFRKRDTG